MPSKPKAHSPKQVGTKHEVARDRSHQYLYSGRWTKYSKMRLRQHPLCVECQKRGLLVPATCTDHIEAHKGDWDLFWSSENHQSLCARCNTRKAIKHEGGFGKVKK